MSKLSLSIAVRDYDRTRPLIDGTVQIDGVDPVYMALEPEEIFFRAFRHAEFDICELSLSSSTVKTAQGDSPMWACRPSCRARSATPRSMCAPTACRTRGPEGPQGRRRRISIDRERLGARPARGRIRREALGHPLDQGRAGKGGAREKIAIKLPADVSSNRPGGPRRSTPCWTRGDRRLHRPAHAVVFERGADIGWLWPTHGGRQGLLPQDRPLPDHAHDRRAPPLVTQHPWLPAAVLKAFTRAKSIASRCSRSLPPARRRCRSWKSRCGPRAT